MQNISCAPLVFEFRCNPAPGSTHSANGVGSFLAALNEIHSDVTFERITGAWWEQERGELAPSPLVRALHGPPSVADGAADPELGHGETAHRRTSLIPVLSCCQSGRSPVRCYSVPSPLCRTPACVRSPAPDTSPKWSSLLSQSRGSASPSRTLRAIAVMVTRAAPVVFNLR